MTLTATRSLTGMAGPKFTAAEMFRDQRERIATPTKRRPEARMVRAEATPSPLLHHIGLARRVGSKTPVSLVVVRRQRSRQTRGRKMLPVLGEKRLLRSRRLFTNRRDTCLVRSERTRGSATDQVSGPALDRHVIADRQPQ